MKAHLESLKCLSAKIGMDKIFAEATPISRLEGVATHREADSATAGGQRRFQAYNRNRGKENFQRKNKIQNQ